MMLALGFLVALYFLGFAATYCLQSLMGLTVVSASGYLRCLLAAALWPLILIALAREAVKAWREE